MFAGGHHDQVCCDLFAVLADSEEEISGCCRMVVNLIIKGINVCTALEMQRTVYTEMVKSTKKAFVYDGS